MGICWGPTVFAREHSADVGFGEADYSALGAGIDAGLVYHLTESTTLELRPSLDLGLGMLTYEIDSEEYNPGEGGGVYYAYGLMSAIYYEN